MICSNCGNFIEDGNTNCQSCGAPIGQPMAGQPMGQPMSGMPNMMPQPGAMPMGYAQPGMNRQQFYKHELVKPLRKQIRSCGIAMYILTAVNIVAMFILAAIGMGFWTILDVMLMLTLGLIIHLLQSRAASIVLTVYGALNIIYYVVTTGQFSGWMFLVIGICAIVYTFKFQKAWKQYQLTGVIPPINVK